MTATAVALCVLCQLLLISGQLFLKWGMDATHRTPPRWLDISTKITAGVFTLSLWFFLWLGLLGDWELTRLFPFEAISPILLAGAAWVFLGERLPQKAWAGMALISVGIALVAAG